mgnify:CR=1 FL=1
MCPCFNLFRLSFIGEVSRVLGYKKDNFCCFYISKNWENEIKMFSEILLPLVSCLHEKKSVSNRLKLQGCNFFKLCSILVGLLLGTSANRIEYTESEIQSRPKTNRLFSQWLLLLLSFSCCQHCLAMVSLKLIEAIR